jgi:hypothetical protein
MPQGDYQTAHVTYANWPCAVFGVLRATAEEAGGTDATALVGFTGIGRPDPAQPGLYQPRQP